MKIIECPKCHTQNIEFVAPNICRCAECGCCFSISSEETLEQNIASEVSDDGVMQANPMNLRPSEYKICPDCKTKIPIDARECPFCGYRTFSGVAIQTGRGCLQGILLYIVMIVGGLLAFYVLIEIIVP